MADSVFREDVAGHGSGQDTGSPDLLLLGEAGSAPWVLGAWLLAVVGVAILGQLAWTFYWSRQRDPTCPLDTPPGSMGWLLVGESLKYFSRGAEFFAEKLRTLGSVYKTHFLFRPTVRLVGAANTKEVLLYEHSRVAMNVPISSRLVFGSRSLACTSGDVHRLLKKEVLQAFSDNVLDRLLPDMTRIVRHHLSEWAQQADVIGFRACIHLTFQVALEVLVGVRVSPEEKEEMEKLFQDILDNFFSLPVDLPGFGYRKLKMARRDLIRRIRAKLETEDVHSDSILGAFWRSHEGSDMADMEALEDMSSELIFAGNSTTASAATSILLCLGKHPEVKGRLREAVAHLPNDPSLKDLNAVPYLDHVLKEVLRCMVPVGAGFRIALKTLQIGGYQIPRGWTIMHSIRETIQTSDLFPNGDQFQPDRWQNLDLHTDGNRGLSYKPFGAGARACAGERFAKMFLKVFMLELIRGDYSWKLKNPDAPIINVPVTRPVDFLPIHFSVKEE